MKRLLLFIAVTVLIMASIMGAFTVTPYRIYWRSGLKAMGPSDTLWSNPIDVQGGSNFTFTSRSWANAACSVSVFFKCGLVQTVDSTITDNHFWSPTTEPGDSTIGLAHAFAANDSSAWGYAFWPEPCKSIMIGIKTNNGAGDSLFWLDSTWVWVWRE